MTKPSDERFDGDLRGDHEDALVDALKSVKPRAPRIDWDAIRGVHISEEATLTTTNPAKIPLYANGSRALTLCSGMAVGAAITFVAMQWMVLSDLRAKLERLEQIAPATAPKSTGLQDIKTRDNLVAEPAFDWNGLLDTPNLSVGSYRGLPDRLVSSRSVSQSFEPSSPSNSDELSRPKNESTPDKNYLAPPSATGAPESERMEPAMNRLWLLKELHRVVH
ncbi:MAG: hypothetical protein ACK52S_06310 [Pirellula sp.]|jgi:hypothetical protein